MGFLPVQLVRRELSRTLALVLCCSLGANALSFPLSSAAWAQSEESPTIPAKPQAKPSSKKAEKEAAEIPTTPSAPPRLDSQTAPEFYRCQRLFTHKGKILGCDSNIRLDGEKLRPILETTPTALGELNEYQKSRARFKNAAYIGTLGLGVILLGQALAALAKRPDPGSSGTDTPQLIRRVTTFTGAGITAGSLLFTLSAIQNNETHLRNAVKNYNEAHPETPIELLFTTQIQF